MSGANSSVPDVSSLSGTEQSVTDDAATETAVDGTEQSEQPPLSIDVVFEVLKNQRRRHVIQYLRDHEGPVELGTVAEHIAALENDKDEAAITYAERKRVYVGLYQCHLPKMDDMGVVEFNRARGRIELTDRVQSLLPYLDGPDTQKPWYRYYGAIVLGGLALQGSAISGVAPTVLTSQTVLAIVLIGMTVCTTSHVVSQYEPDDEE